MDNSLILGLNLAMALILHAGRGQPRGMCLTLHRATQLNSLVTDFSSKKPWILDEGVDNICQLEALFSFATFELKNLSL